jgi:Ribosomal L27 protein
VRQRGTNVKPGAGVGIDNDDTLYARAAGTVRFGAGPRGCVVSVLPAAGKGPVELLAPPRTGDAAAAQPESPSLSVCACRRGAWGGWGACGAWAL